MDLEKRKSGIGSSEIAAVCGLNKWRGPIDVYMSKLGLIEDQEDNDNLWFGRELEPVLIKRYEQETGRKVTIPDSDTLPCQHPGYPWFMFSPDGTIYIDNPIGYKGCSKLEGIVECKTTGYSHLDEWGEPGTDEIPQEYLIQCQWLMEGSGAKWADVPVLFMGQRREFRIYRVMRDDELIASLIEKGREFWENHIIPQIPPPVNDSPGWDKFIKKSFPKDELPIIQATAEMDVDLWDYRNVCDKFKAIESRKQYWENNIKAAIGVNLGIESQFGRITWKASKDRTVVDWEKAFRELSSICDEDDKIDQIIKICTTTKPGPRVFRATWKKETE